MYPHHRVPKFALPTARHDHQADGIMSCSPLTTFIDSVYRETTLQANMAMIMSMPKVFADEDGGRVQR
ncbi:hypothetical protein HYQ46_011693 [Verticillium longisporum]|nr:hypothetical protein HYQ46_011693 [Verticillium longisporum]